MEHLEIELKFFVSGFESVRSRLTDLGAACTVPETLEYNVRYETTDDRLLADGCLLRLRKARHATMTFKSLPSTVDTRFKTYRELEVRVDDFDTMDAILQALGFIRRQVYEKWRETWQCGEAMVCLDTMPYGHFLEIEGPPDAIITTIASLNLSWHRRILDNYLGIFNRLQQEEAISFNDLTFTNFQRVDVDFDRYRHLFEVGETASP